MVRVALAQRAAWQPVKTHHQHVGAGAFALPVVEHAGGECADVSRIVVKVAHEIDAWEVAHASRPSGDRVEGARGRRGGVLGVERQRQDVVAPVGVQGIERVGYRGVAVAHAKGHLESVNAALVQESRQQSCLALGVHQQRRALFAPDHGVLFRRRARPQVEDDAVEDQPPGGARNFDHPVVGEELFEVTAHRGGCRGVRRSEVGQQDAGLRRAAVGEVRRRAVFGHELRTCPAWR